MKFGRDIGPWLVATGLASLTLFGADLSWRRLAAYGMGLPICLLIQNRQPELALAVMGFTVVNLLASAILLPGWVHHVIIMFDCVCVMWVYLDCQ